MAYDDDDVPLHPRVRQAILEGNRDLPLTLNWTPLDPHAYDFLGLPKLNPLATKERTQIITEALAAGDRFISYSRRNTFYSQGQRYYRSTFTRAAVLPAVAQLTDAGLLEHERVPQGHRGFQSRFRASPTLLTETTKVELVYEPMEIIIVRDVNGIAIDYRDNRHTRAMRRRLEGLNERLVAQQIGLDGRIIREGDRLDNGGRAQVQLNRIFHRGDFNLGGRFYGGHWQNIGDRHRLDINGQPTIEVDYVAIHVHLLYQEIGKPAPADPYDLDGWPRKHAKLALLIGINARTRLDAVRALADALRLDGCVCYPFAAAKALLQAIKGKHPDIAHAFGSDAGVRLMRRDSDLAEQIMLEMVRTTGIVPLPVHDSFIVPSAHEGKLREIMESSTPCRTATTKSLVGQHVQIPCGTDPQNRDNLSPVNPTASPKTVPQYGMGCAALPVAALREWTGTGLGRRYELSTDPRGVPGVCGCQSLRLVG
jgi:hypothetical protein